MKYYEVPKHIIREDFPGKSEFDKDMRRDAADIAKRLRGKIPLEIGKFLERVYTKQLRASQTYTPLLRIASSIEEADVLRNGGRVWGTNYANTFMKPFSFTNFLGNIVGAGEWKNRDMAIVAYVPTRNLDYTPGVTMPMYLPDGQMNGIDAHRLLPEFIACTLDIKDEQIVGINHNPGFTTRHDYSHKGLKFDDSVFQQVPVIGDRDEAEKILRAGLQTRRDELKGLKPAGKVPSPPVKLVPRPGPIV